MTFEEWWYTYKRWDSFHNACMEDATQDAYKAGQRSILVDMWPSDKDSFTGFRASHKYYPSQDNEGYLPDRGGFKAGWYSYEHWLRGYLQQKLSREGEE